jgi:peptidoglycan-associated lipoprotein
MKKTTNITILALAALVVLTGCAKKGAKAGSDLDDGVFNPVDSGFTDAESGIPLDGTPFDQNRTPIGNSGIGPVYFGYDSSVLAPAELAKIQQAADYMTGNAGIVLIVEGHCDERGSNEYNLSLGEQRALALRSALVNLGISADRIQSRSFGEEKPAVLGSGEAAWAQNRRGEFAFYK